MHLGVYGRRRAEVLVTYPREARVRHSGAYAGLRNDKLLWNTLVDGTSGSRALHKEAAAMNHDHRGLIMRTRSEFGQVQAVRDVSSPGVCSGPYRNGRRADKSNLCWLAMGGDSSLISESTFSFRAADPFRKQHHDCDKDGMIARLSRWTSRILRIRGKLASLEQ